MNQLVGEGAQALLYTFQTARLPIDCDVRLESAMCGVADIGDRRTGYASLIAPSLSLSLSRARAGTAS